jgi:hypothetical protein
MAWLIVGLMALPALIGLFTLYHWLRPPPKPVDRSNVISRIRLWWFALTRQDLFIELFPWLGRDELENMRNSRGSMRETTREQ